MQSVCEFSDRDVLLGISSAVIAVAEKLTGEKLTVCIGVEAGEAPIYANRVRWTDKEPADSKSKDRHNVVPSDDAVIWARPPGIR